MTAPSERSPIAIVTQRSWSSSKEIVSRPSFSTAEGLLGEVLRLGKVIRIAEPDPAKLRRVVHERFWDLLERYPVYALMLAPIGNAGRVFGVAAVMRGTAGRPFDEQDEALVVDLAARAGLAVANARSTRRPATRSRNKRSPRRACARAKNGFAALRRKHRS